MSVFSDLLKNYIHEKKVKVMSLAQYCDLERSTIYKFINGKREPMSAELVEQMAYFMKENGNYTKSFQEYILVKENGKWKILSFQKNVSKDESKTEEQKG